MVWKYFKINDDNNSKGDSKLCSVTLSRGTMSVNFNTSNLIKHLKHIKKNTATLQATSSRGTQHPTLKEALQRREKIPRDSPRATNIKHLLSTLHLMTSHCPL